MACRSGSDAQAHIFRFGSLFSGAGGLDLGFLSAGCFSIEFAVEALKAPARTYSDNFGLPVCPAVGFPNGRAVYEGDVGQIDFSGPAVCGVDILAGGPPCQDFSVVRGPEWDRQGIRVERGRLYLQFIRALTSLKPKLFVFENVPGLISANRGWAYRAVLDGFQEAGWAVVFADIVDCALLGVPQRRRRLIIVGLRRDLLKRTSLSRAHHLFRDRLTGRGTLLPKYPLTPLEAFEGLPLPLLEDKYREVMSEYEDILGAGKRWSVLDDYLSANRIDPSSWDEVESAFEQHEQLLRELGWLGKRVCELNLPDGSTKRPRESPAVLERMKHIPPDGNHELVRGTRWEVEGRGISLIYRRLHPLKPAYTVVAYGGGGTWGYHYERSLSKLTHRERARLQTFPDWFRFSGTCQEIRAQIGEAVPPLLGKRIASACAELLAEISV